MISLLRLLVVLVFLLSTTSFAEEVVPFDELVEREGVFYKKFSTEPFTGKSSGRVQSHYDKGIPNGLYLVFWDNGQLFRQGTYNKNGNREGPFIAYWSNGQLWRRGTYKDGKQEGLWFSFNEDGTENKKYTGIYKNVKKVKDIRKP